MTLLFLDPDWPRALRGGSKSRPASRRRAVNALDPARPRWVIPLVIAYLAAQTLIPLRHWLYPGDVSWTDEGHRFSWRMKLRTKQSRIDVTMFDPATGRAWVVKPNERLDERQVRYMEGRPDMAVQFAHYLRDHYRTEGVERPEVYVRLRCSLNGRPEQDLIRPGVNLAEVPRTLWPADWIVRDPAVAVEAHSTLSGVAPAAVRSPGAGRQ